MDEHDETESHVSSDSDEGDSSSLAKLAESVPSVSVATEQSHGDIASDDTHGTGESSQSTSLSELAQSIRGKRTATNERADGDQSSTEWGFDDSERDPFDADVELDSEAAAVVDSVKDEAAILLVGPSECQMVRVLCRQLMTPKPGSTNHRQLLVSADTHLQQQREILRRIRHESVDSQVLVDAQSYTTSNTVDDYDEMVRVLNVPTARDVRRIGILTTKVLTEWADTETPSTVCLHTLSGLLDAVDDAERVFRFVHLLQERIRASSARGLFYLDPARHDEQTIRTFFSLFDTILEYDVDGSLESL
ncbi:MULTISPECIES: hypothetical protein [Haloferax]|uniref:KaiC-like domain-containing protein n=1 Tax=Haloferax marinum TaxID=2666143 RepID=A0A6A8G8M6_9EURY|nr:MULTISPECIES: hypothetical protein [Haloferax]KAB1198157.1 hypothetical protein Hfx1150_11765 [Haloferax sp. CBA1150]MRW97237.1 hypothetical protein [Haloferax marinum]